MYMVLIHVIFIFIDGQTGSGKTFTMRGCDDDPGMMLLCINDIFDFIDSKKKDCKYTLKIAYMEVYNEEINDLLGEGPVSWVDGDWYLFWWLIDWLMGEFKCLGGDVWLVSLSS